MTRQGNDSGSAYVFTRATASDLASGWTQVAKLTADDGAADDYFGSSVSIDGDTVVIGAKFHDDKASDSGSAYVFTRATASDLASGWTQVAKLTDVDGAAGDEFGKSVSIDGNTVVIGANRDDDKGSTAGRRTCSNLHCPLRACKFRRRLETAPTTTASFPSRTATRARPCATMDSPPSPRRRGASTATSSPANVGAVEGIPGSITATGRASSRREWARETSSEA